MSRDTHERIEKVEIANLRAMLCAWDGCSAKMLALPRLKPGWVGVIVLDRDVPGFKLNLAASPAIKHDLISVHTTPLNSNGC